MRTKLFKLMLLLSSLFLMACGDSGGGRKVGTGGGNGYTPNGNSGYVTQNLEQLISNINQVYDRKQIYFYQTNLAQNIDYLVQQMLFVGQTPSYDIYNVNSIQLHIDLKMGMNQNYQVTQQHLQQYASQIQMYLRIDDDYSSYQGQDPIYVGYGPGTLSSYSVDANGNISLFFSDSYGSINIRVQNGQVSLSFTNSGQSEQNLGTVSSYF